MSCFTLCFNVMFPFTTQLFYPLKRSSQCKTSQYSFLKEAFSFVGQSLQCSNCRLQLKAKKGISSPLLKWLCWRGFYTVNCQLNRGSHQYLHSAFLIWQTDSFQVYRSVMTSQKITLSSPIMLMWWGTMKFSCIPWELTANCQVSSPQQSCLKK